MEVIKVGVLLLITLLVAKFISTLIIRKTKSNKKRLPPAINSSWTLILGGLLRFWRGPVVFLKEEYPKLGSVFTVKLLHKNITFLIGPEVSGHFFKAPESDLSQKDVYKFTVPTFGPGVMYDLDYSPRQEQMRFFIDFSDHFRYVDQLVLECQDYFSKWGDSGLVDLKDVLQKLVVLTASRSLLGEEVRDNLFGEDVSALIQDLSDGMLPITVVLPNMPLPAHRRRDKARKKLEKIFASIIASRRKSGKKVNDLMQCFMDSKYKDGRPTTDAEVIGLLIGGLFAGQHTSSISSTWTGVYLLSNEKYMSRVLDEQKNMINKYGATAGVGDHDDNYNKLVNYKMLSEMDVLHRCVKEALRLHPPNQLLLRSAHNDFTVTTKEGKVYDIPKGHIVAISPHLSNRLPHIYKDPDTFDPDRFSPGREEDKAGEACSYTSFGGGRHRCVGEQFAYLQIKAIWSHLLRNFELELISPFPEIDWINATIMLGVKGKIMVQYKRRKLIV